MRITILMPAYEDADLFEKTIKSVLRQHNVILNVFVSDDSRTSSIERCVKKLEDPRVVYTRNKVQKGLAENSNHLLNYVRSGWFKFQHQDDVLFDDYVLFDLLEAAEKYPKASFIFGMVEVIGTSQSNQRKYAGVEQLLASNTPITLLADNIVGSVSNMIINSSMASVKWNPSLKYFLDVNYYMRIFDCPIFVPRMVTKSCHGGKHQITPILSRNRNLKAREALYILSNTKKHINENISVDIFSWLFPMMPFQTFNCFYKNNLKMINMKSIYRLIKNFVKYYVAKKEIV